MPKWITYIKLMVAHTPAVARSKSGENQLQLRIHPQTSREKTRTMILVSLQSVVVYSYL